MALALVLSDESSAAAERLLREVAQGNADVLTALHWPLEVANGLLQAGRRRLLAAADRLIACDFLFGLPVTVIGEQPPTADLFALADQERLSVYDACYLALAIRREAPIATTDGPLRRAARRRGLVWSVRA
jgi:predicted nucleic acid-binding protein